MTSWGCSRIKNDVRQNPSWPLPFGIVPQAALDSNDSQRTLFSGLLSATLHVVLTGDLSAAVSML